MEAWNTSGVLLRIRQVWQLPYGTAANVTAPLLRPPTGLLCGAPNEAWRNFIILGDDWSTPGCSMEHRARIIQSAGAAAAIFVGTEGVPFDWDGSDTSDITLMTGVVPWSDYARLEGHLESGFLNATVAATPTPLLDPAFAMVQWLLFVIAILGVCINLCAAVYQFYRFSRTQVRHSRRRRQHPADYAAVYTSLHFDTTAAATNSNA